MHKEMFELEKKLEARANLELLEQALLHSDDKNRIVFIETKDRQYEISSVEVHQQINVSNDIETVIIIKVIQLSEKRLINFRSISIIVFWIAFICTFYFKSIEWLLFSTFMCGVIASNLVWGLSVDE